MRKLIYIILLAVCDVLLSCSHPHYRKGLVEADSIISANPQQAMTMLDSMRGEMEAAPEHEQMYYRLLCVKASDKAYVTHTSDSVIRRLIRYYEERGDNGLLPEVYYYAGRTYSDMNDAPEAQVFYQKALDVTPADDVALRGRVYSQTARLLSAQALYAPAVEAYGNACELCRRQGDMVGIVYVLRDMAYVYDKMGEADSSLACYRRAYGYAKSLNDIRLMTNVSSQMASFYIGRADYAKAWEYLRPALVQHDSIDMSADYAMALKICMNTGRYDSAHYYGTVLLDIGSVYAKQTASRCLAELALSDGDHRNASEYLRMFYEYTDSVSKITATETVSRMNALYNYSLREKENLRLKAEKARLQLMIFVGIAISFIVISLVVIYILRYNRKKRQQVERLKYVRKRLYERSEEFMQANNIKLERLEQELSQVTTENRMLSKKLEQERNDLILANEEARNKQTKYDKVRERLTASDVYSCIKECANSGRMMTKADWEELSVLIDEEISGFKNLLLTYYNITEHEYRICMLIRLGLSPTEMACVMRRSVSAVSKTRKRLQEKLFGNGGTTAEFDDFIKSL